VSRKEKGAGWRGGGAGGKVAFSDSSALKGSPSKISHHVALLLLKVHKSTFKVLETAECCHHECYDPPPAGAAQTSLEPWMIFKNHYMDLRCEQIVRRGHLREEDSTPRVLDVVNGDSPPPPPPFVPL